MNAFEYRNDTDHVQYIRWAQGSLVVFSTTPFDLLPEQVEALGNATRPVFGLLWRVADPSSE